MVEAIIAVTAEACRIQGGSLTLGDTNRLLRQIKQRFQIYKLQIFFISSEIIYSFYFYFCSQFIYFTYAPSIIRKNVQTFIIQPHMNTFIFDANRNKY